MTGKGSNLNQEKRFDEQYKLCEILGQGTFGKVHKCVDQVGDGCFAVKTVQIRDADTGQGLAREVSIWKELKHANIVLLHSIFCGDSVAHLVMEYVEGKSLFDEMLIQVTYTERQACEVMVQVCANPFIVCRSVSSTSITRDSFQPCVCDGLVFFLAKWRVFIARQVGTR